MEEAGDRVVPAGQGQHVGGGTTTPGWREGPPRACPGLGGQRRGQPPTNRAPLPQRPEGDSVDRPLNPRCSPGPTPRVRRGACARAVGRPHETGHSQLPPAMGQSRHLPFCQGQDPACSRRSPGQAPPVAHPAHLTMCVSRVPCGHCHPVPSSPTMGTMVPRGRATKGPLLAPQGLNTMVRGYVWPGQGQ